MGINDEIKNAVNWDAPSVDVNDSIRVGIQKMVKSKASALVVKSGGQVIGVLTDMDVMSCIDRNEDINKATAVSCMTACEMMVGDVVKSPCVQLDSSQSVENALGVMNRAGVHHLLVSGEDETCTGVVSIVDLLGIAIK